MWGFGARSGTGAWDSIHARPVHMTSSWFAQTAVIVRFGSLHVLAALGNPHAQVKHFDFSLP